MRPDIHYARAGDVHVAYTVVGAGPDLVVVPGALATVEWQFEDPRGRRFFERLASFARVITFDKRGTGRSDPIEGTPTLEERVDDMRAVMDAAGCERPMLFGYSEGGSMSIMLAATYPERVAGLILWAAPIRLYPDPYDESAPFVITKELVPLLLDAVDAAYETGDMPTVNPDANADPEIRRWQKRYLILGASPAKAKDTFTIGLDFDLRPVLPTIKAPTLLIQRADEEWVRIAHARVAASLIPGAKLIELPGRDHFPFYGDDERLLAEIEAFVTGSKPAPKTDRVLATVMFTDLVSSTETAASLGDKRWRAVLEHHDSLVGEEIARFGGKRVKSTGDGVLATFDGPSRGVHCAHALHEHSKEFGVAMRAGLHTGEVELIGNDIGGIAVHIASRVSSLAGPGEVLVSSTVKDLSVGSGLRFAERGTHTLKGVPDVWRVYATSVS